MKAFKFHINAIKITIEQLSKGRFLAFFIPALVLTIVYWYFEYNLTRASSIASWFSSLPWVGEYLDTGITYSFSALDWFLTQVYIFVVLTVLSPVNTYLSEKLDGRLTGFDIKFDILRFINDFFRMLFIVILAIIMELFFMAIYWLLSKIFGLGFIDNVMYFMIAAFFFGFSFYDYSLERYGVGVSGTIGYAFKNMLTMILTGTIFLLLFKIPYVGIPIAPGIAVMVATIVYLYRENKYPVKTDIKSTEKNDEFIQ
jgi:CysZ protein